VTPPDRAGAFRPVDRPVRLVRSSAAALVCVTAAAAGHHTAGGPLPGGAVLAVFGTSLAVAWLLSARRITAGQLLGLLVLCQVAVHGGTASDEMVMGAGMLAAHAVATVVSVVALAYGEAFAWHVAERLALRLAPLLCLPAVVPSARPSAAVVAPRSLIDICLAHSRSLRGPPVGLA
jgi:hypothetical protein